MIPFRTQRLATSVVNRIMDVYDGLPPRAMPGQANAPEPTPGGAQIDAQLQQPQPQVDADPTTAEAIALKAANLV